MIQNLEYSHNLNILLVDNNNNIIENKILLQQIYDEFVDKPITHIFDMKYEICLYWKKVDTKNKFIGNLFIRSLYSDNVLYETTKKILNEIENKLKKNIPNKNWKIIFYISKLLENVDMNVFIN